MAVVMVLSRTRSGVRQAKRVAWLDATLYETKGLVVDTVDRNYVESLINRAQGEALRARDVADTFGLSAASERLTWALDFLDAARAKLPESERNPNGTTGPEHVTDRGIELEPAQG